MDSFRGIVIASLALLNLFILVNAKAKIQRRFGHNISHGFGKRGSIFPGFGKRPYSYGTGNAQDHENNEDVISTNEQKMPYWKANSVPVIDWTEYGYQKKDEPLPRKLEPPQKYVNPFRGYVSIDDYSTVAGNDNKRRQLQLESGKNYFTEPEDMRLSRERPNTIQLQDRYADETEVDGSHQKPVDDRQNLLSELLLNLLSQTDEENDSYSDWQ